MPVFRRCREWILLSSARGYSAQAYQATEHDVQAWGKAYSHEGGEESVRNLNLVYDVQAWGAKPIRTRSRAEGLR